MKKRLYKPYVSKEISERIKSNRYKSDLDMVRKLIKGERIILIGGKEPSPFGYNCLIHSLKGGN